MPRLQWKTNRSIAIGVSLVLLYFLIRLKKYEHDAIVFLNKTRAIEVWEYVADFSNMKRLNPTIVNFNIVDESGNYDHWKYTVEYSEHLSHWPYLSNHATANFNVKSNPKKNVFYIDSVHRTCLIFGLLCLDSLSEFRFTTNSSDGTLCKETVVYQCPVFLFSFCQREVKHQRSTIMNNLKKHFEKTLK